MISAISDTLAYLCIYPYYTELQDGFSIFIESCSTFCMGLGNTQILFNLTCYEPISFFMIVILIEIMIECDPKHMDLLFLL